MDKFLEAYNLPKLHQEESENLHIQITTSENEAVIKKTKKKPSEQTKVLDQMASILPNIQRRTNTNSSQTIPKNSRGGKTPMLILQGQHYSNSKTR